MRSFAESPDAVALPTPIVRGIAGGLYGTASTFLRQPPAAGRGRTKLADEMLRWTLLLQGYWVADIRNQLGLAVAAPNPRDKNSCGECEGAGEMNEAQCYVIYRPSRGPSDRTAHAAPVRDARRTDHIPRGVTVAAGLWRGSHIATNPLSRDTAYQPRSFEQAERQHPMSSN